VRTKTRWGAVTVAAVAAVAATTALSVTAGDASAPAVHVPLAPSSDQLAACMPRADVDVSVKLTTDTVGFDSFRIDAEGLPASTAFTVFLLEDAVTPFGAAEYIGDITTNAKGKAHNEFRLIVQEAFSSTLVGGSRVRVDLNQIGMWFADPADDDFCLGVGSPITPFDGDNAAGVQAFNSRNGPALPAP
jgi:hypothetical protein